MAEDRDLEMIRNAVVAALGAICDQLGGYLIDVGEKNLA